MLKNKLVLVTGGSKGIGLACVQAFLEEGAQVLVNYHHEKGEIELLEDQFPNQILCVQGDVSNESDIQNMFNVAEKHFGKKVSVLVNNAGIANRQKFSELDAESFLQTLKMNTVAPFLVAREFSARLGNETGSIVHIGSMRAFVPTSVDYSASKAALHNMTISLAKALAPNIRVNCVAPGFTETGMHSGNIERLQKEAILSLLQRFSAPSEIADAVMFFASEKAKAITGQVLLVDNGRSFSC